MVKTLTIGIPDKDKDNHLNIMGTRDESQFNTIVVIAMGQVKIAVDSKLLAQALSEIVDFQRPRTPISPITNSNVGYSSSAGTPGIGHD